MSNWHFAGYTRRGRINSAVRDPFFANVLLLAGFNGNNHDLAYTAETGQIATIASASELSTTQAKFWNTSFACVNTTTLSFPASPTWDLSPTNNTPFTIEWWQWLPDLIHTVNTLQTGYNADGFLIRAADVTTFGYFWIDAASGSDSYQQTLMGLTATQWDAVCLEKNTSGVIRLYTNGVMKKKATPADSTIKTSTSALFVGPSMSGATGYMNELRITAAARYDNDGGYAVQTEPFPRS